MERKDKNSPPASADESGITGDIPFPATRQGYQIRKEKEKQERNDNTNNPSSSPPRVSSVAASRQTYLDRKQERKAAAADNNPNHGGVAFNIVPSHNNTAREEDAEMGLIHNNDNDNNQTESETQPVLLEARLVEEPSVPHLVHAEPMPYPQNTSTNNNDNDETNKPPADHQPKDGRRKWLFLIMAALIIVAISVSLGVALGKDDRTSNDANNEQSTLSPSTDDTPETPITTSSPTAAEPLGREIWTQIGGDLNGDYYLGSSLSLSGNGQILAIGGGVEGGDEGGSDFTTPTVRSFEWIDNSAWVPLIDSQLINSDINPQGSDEVPFYKSVALSDDGLALAIGVPQVNGTGYVQVFRLVEIQETKQWEPFGEVIVGEDYVDPFDDDEPERVYGGHFGWAVSLSSNGTTLAVGAPWYEPDNKLGRAFVYKFSISASEWVQLGGAIDEGLSEYTYSQFGKALSLSGDGMTLVVGAPTYDAPFDEQGQVQVLTYQNGTWNRVGEPIPGESRSDLWGTSVAISKDGNTIAAGAVGNQVDYSTFAGTGHVRIFRLFSDNWSQIGQDIDGTVDGGKLGSSVSLTSDGNTVVVGAPGNGTGIVQVYRFSESRWTQVGDNLEGEYPGDSFGASTAISSNGDIVGVGGPMNQESLHTIGGHARIYRLDRES